MTLTFESDLDRVHMSQLAKYLGQRSFRSKVIVHIHTHTHTHIQTHRIKCSIRVTKEADKNN